MSQRFNRGGRSYTPKQGRSNWKNKHQNNQNGWNKPRTPYNVNNGCCDDDTNWVAKSSNNQNKTNIYENPYKEAYFDSHCHMDWILFKNGYSLRQFPEFAQKNFKGNFGGCVTVACSKDMIRPVSELINSTHQSNKNIYGSFGLHPHNAKEWNDSVKQEIVNAVKTGNYKFENGNKNTKNLNNEWECICGHSNKIQHVFCENCTFEPTPDYLENLEILNAVKLMDLDDDDNKEKEKKNSKKCSNKKVVAVGECGLDYHYNKSPHGIQKKVFIEQIEIAKQLDMPLVIHSRKAENDTIEIMKKYCPSNKNIHLHCFTDSTWYANVMMKEFPNLFIGFTGAITFKNAHKNRKTVESVPLKRILLETDGPYMSPVPFRGRVSHPGYIPLVAQTVAEVHNITDVNHVLRQCTKNAKIMYRI